MAPGLHDEQLQYADANAWRHCTGFPILEAGQRADPQRRFVQPVQPPARMRRQFTDGTSTNRLSPYPARRAQMFEAQKANASGRYFPVSRFRRLVIDMMHFSAHVPSVTIERQMDLGQLVGIREACTPSPSWSAIFIKAFAIVAARTPLLRTAYLTLPWPRYYEHSSNIATLNIDRQLADERIVLHAQVPSPERLPLPEIDRIIAEHQQRPVAELPSYRRATRLARVPWPFRRLVWRAGLDMLGSARCRFFGTFGITSLGAFGAGMLNLVPLLTSTIHYGMFDAAGVLEMRLSFDHRVFDGATAARALADMEAVLGGEVLAECRNLGGG